MDTPLKQTIIFDNTAKLRQEIDEFRKEFDEFKIEFDEFNIARDKKNSVIFKYSHLFAGVVLGPS